MTQTLTAVLRSGAVGMALIGLAACSSKPHYPPVSAAPSPTAASESTAPVAQATIKDVQTALQKAGYYKNETVDGLWGRRTERSLRRFQHDHNVTANGKLDIPTMQALDLTGPPPSTSNNAAAVNTGNGNAGPNNTQSDSGTSGTMGQANNPPPASDTTGAAPPANTATPNAPAGANSPPNH